MRRQLERELTLATLAALAACNSGAGFPDATAKKDSAQVPGTFAYTWSLVNGSGSAVTCAEANALQVQIAVLDATTTPPTPEVTVPYTCSFDDSVSSALFPSTYDLEFSLLGSGSAVIATAPEQTGLVIMSNMTTTVPNVQFSVP